MIFLIYLGWIGVVVIILTSLSVLFTNGLVEGQSMEPTFKDNERVILAKYKKIQRFDIVAFKPPNQSKDKYLKRVIGLPGEKVEYRNGQLFIDDLPVEDPFAAETKDFSLDEIFGSQTVPENYFFVLGDNRKNSLDSRSFGYLKKTAIYGYVFE